MLGLNLFFATCGVLHLQSVSRGGSIYFQPKIETIICRMPAIDKLIFFLHTWGCLTGTCHGRFIWFLFNFLYLLFTTCRFLLRVLATGKNGIMWDRILWNMWLGPWKMSSCGWRAKCNSGIVVFQMIVTCSYYVVSNHISPRASLSESVGSLAVKPGFQYAPLVSVLWRPECDGKGMTTLVLVLGKNMKDSNFKGLYYLLCICPLLPQTCCELKNCKGSGVKYNMW